MSVPDTFIFNIKQVIAAVDGATNSFLSCISLAVTELFDPTYSSEQGMRKFRNYGAIGGIGTAWRGISPFCVQDGIIQTGFKGFNTLEQYYTADNSPTGVTKDNSESDPDYVPPVHDVIDCPYEVHHP